MSVSVGEQRIVVTHDQTDMGGTVEAFRTTQWSLIEDIQTQPDPERVMIGLLLQRYWKSVYCYLRHSGHDNEQAKDLTQGFFHEVVLGRQLVQRADPAKGRFRDLLLHALKQYIIDVKRRDSTHTTIPPEKLISLEMAHLPILPQTTSTWGPEECFLYAWKAALLDQTLATVKEECLSRGLQIHWQLFRDHIVRPTLEGCESPPLKELCRRYNIDSEKTAANMVTTVKRRFQQSLRQHLRGSTGFDAEADEELRDFLQT